MIIKKIDQHWETFDGKWNVYKTKREALGQAILKLDPIADYIEIHTEILK
jgi:hypothetical protein